MASQLDLAWQLLRRAIDDKTAASALLEATEVSDACVVMGAGEQLLDKLGLGRRRARSPAEPPASLPYRVPYTACARRAFT